MWSALPLSPQDAKASSDVDDSMLNEYDFSKGVRNKYAHRYQHHQQDNLPGIHFVTDAVGKKIGALLNLQIHRSLWDTQLQTISGNDLSFLTNSQGEQLSVFIDFESHLDLWQRIYDTLLERLALTTHGAQKRSK